jgi:hypothetical protein
MCDPLKTVVSELVKNGIDARYVFGQSAAGWRDPLGRFWSAKGLVDYRFGRRRFRVNTYCVTPSGKLCAEWNLRTERSGCVITAAPQYCLTDMPDELAAVVRWLADVTKRCPENGGKLQTLAAHRAFERDPWATYREEFLIPV